MYSIKSFKATRNAKFVPPLQYKTKEQFAIQSLASQSAVTSCKNMASNPYGALAAAPIHKTLVSSFNYAWSYADACGRTYSNVISVDLHHNVSAVQATSNGLKTISYQHKGKC
jgi:hypothetical protein